MLSRRSVLLGSAALVGTALVGGVFVVRDRWDTRAGPEVTGWLKTNAIPLATAEPGSGWRDLEPLRAAFGAARIVSMGEATHGTHEFFQLKHRLIEFCVSELGFTVIGFEAEYGTTLAVNDYVLHGKGNALDVIGAMRPGIWDTEEVVALVSWLQTWNASHERKVKFCGFDMQTGAGSGPHLLAYLARVSPDLATTSQQKLASLVAAGASFRKLPAMEQEQALTQIATVLDFFTTQRASWISQTSETEWHLARQSAIVLEQFARYDVIDGGWMGFVNGHRYRDRSMAANVRTLLESDGPDAKAVLWAHNGHVQRTSSHLFRLFEMTSMGSVLHAAVGSQMVVVGCAFNQGSFLARSITGELGSHDFGPAPDGLVDAALATVGLPLLALDLTKVPADAPVARWLARKPPQRSVGAVFFGSEKSWTEAGDPRDKYDVLLFVDRTTPSRRNPRPA
jgi:erythromycin esterase